MKFFALTEESSKPLTATLGATIRCWALFLVAATVLLSGLVRAAHRFLPCLVLLMTVFLGFSPLWAVPVVSNLTSAQRAGTKLVDITYDLATPGFPSASVSLKVSSDGGTTWTVPVTSVSGNLGASTAPGIGKTIVWDAGTDWPLSYSTQMRFRVVADDGYTASPDEDAEAAPTAYRIESTALVNYPLTAGQSYAVGFRLIDPQSGLLAPVDGSVTLGLLNIDRQPVGFAYTLSPATLPVVQGVVSGSVTVTSASDLSAAYMAVTAFQASAPLPAPMVNSLEKTINLSAASTPAAAPQQVLELFDLLGIALPKRLEEYARPSPWVGLVYPLPGSADNYRISGSYGEWRKPGRPHDGLDLTATPGTLVRAISGGVVSWVGNLGSDGGLVVINHGNGYCSRYLHIDSSVVWNQVVADGEWIGKVAAITAPHLHLEIRKNCPAHYYEYQPGRDGAPFQTGQVGAGVTLGTQVNPLLFNGLFTTSPLLTAANDTKPPQIRGLNFFSTATGQRPSTDLYFPASQTGIKLDGGRVDAEGVIEVVDTEATTAAPYVLPPRSLLITESLPDGTASRELANVSFERESGVRPLFHPYSGQNPATHGYAIPFSLNLERKDSFPFWFKWDTSRYANTPDGPRKLTFTATDWMERQATHVATFGPAFPQAVPSQSVPEDPDGVTFDVKVKAHLGPFLSGMTGFAKDRLALSFRGEPKADFAYEAFWIPPGGAEEAETSVEFEGANAATPHVEKTLQVRVRLKPGTEMPQEPQTLVLLAKSGNFPNLAHDLEVELGPSICAPLPLDGTPPAAPAGFSLIPGGSFTMGRTSGDTDLNAPPTTVTLSPFYMQQTETTKAHWDEVRAWALSHGYEDLAVGDGKASDHPAQTVSWYDVVKWCNARSEKEGLSPCYYTGPERRADQIYRSGSADNLTVCWGANGYRLPTEAEWEKAARGGVIGKRFPWGTDTISHAQANYYGSYQLIDAYDLSPINNYHPSYSAGGPLAFPFTSPVGSFGASGYGLYDMAGNASEWCWDWYEQSYYTTSNGTTDPRGPASGSARVFRGGGWNGLAIYCRAAYRDNYSPGNRNVDGGFRPARSSVP